MFFHWDKCLLIFYIFLVSDLKKKKNLPNCSLPFKRNISAKKKMWKCRHSSENSILHSTEPLRSLLNDPFYHGAMSVPFWIVRPGKKNRCMYTSGWVMYYSYALCSFWQTDLIKGKKAIHCDKLSLTRKSELEARVLLSGLKCDQNNNKKKNCHLTSWEVEMTGNWVPFKSKLKLSCYI